MTDLDDELRDRVQAELAERQRRRRRMRHLRTELQSRRDYAKSKINERRLAMRAGTERPTVSHWWRCYDRTVVDEVRQDATGQTVIVQRCVGCGGTDSTSSDDSPDAA